MASVQARRPTITALPGASDFAAAAASSAHSPLDQLGMAMRRGSPTEQPNTAAVQRSAPPPVPTLDLNLFRSPSIYSVESNLDTISLTSEEHHAAYGDQTIGYGYGFTNEPEEQGTDDDEYDSPEEGTEINFGADPTSTPSTPRAARRMASDEVMGGSPVRSGASTPTFRVHRPNQYAGGPAPPPVPTVPFNVRSAVSDGPFALHPVPVRNQRSASSLASSSTTTTVTLQQRSSTEPVVARDAPVTRDAPAPHQPQTSTVPDWASVHGEQGSDWGDDEAEFEWLDKGHPEAVNGNSNGTVPRRLGLSPKRLSRIRAAVPNLTPNLVPPSFATGNGSGGSSGSNSSASSPVSPGPPDGPQRARTKKKRPIVIPRRAAPPPPTGAPSTLPPTRSRSPQPLRSPPTRDGNSVFDSAPSGEAPRTREQSSPELETRPVLPPVVIINATPDRVTKRQPHLMVPLKDGDGGNRPGLKRVPSHQSEHSMQSSLAYSFYDLEDGSAAPSRSESPSRIQETHPRGRYAKIPITTIDPTGGSRVRVTDTTTTSRSPVTPVTPGISANGHSRLNLQSASTTSLSSISAAGLTPDELVAAGLEQRRAGQLPKAAYMFMKAGEAGGATGQIYWGLALRHG